MYYTNMRINCSNSSLNRSEMGLISASSGLGRSSVAIFVSLAVLSLLKEANCSWGSNLGRAALLERFSWRILDFAYPDELSRQLAIAKGQYVPENALPVGIEIWKNKLFVSVPRWKEGKDRDPARSKSITVRVLSNKSGTLNAGL